MTTLRAFLFTLTFLAGAYSAIAFAGQLYSDALISTAIAVCAAAGVLLIDHRNNVDDPVSRAERIVYRGGVWERRDREAGL